MGLIYLDACLVIYLVEQDVVWGKRLAEAIAGAANVHYAISPLVKMECLIGPVRHGDLVRERAFNRLFETVVLLNMPDEVYLQAAQLRGRFGLKTPDALHLACAQHHHCDALWTNDERLHQSISRSGADDPEAMSAGPAMLHVLWRRCSSSVMATLWEGVASMPTCAENE